MLNGYEHTFEGILSFIPLISVICTWKIFADRGEAGWKALIPFYSFLIFGRIAGDEKKGKRLMIAAIISLVFAIAFFISLTFALAGFGSESAVGVILVLSFIGMCISVIFACAEGILLKVKFVEKEKDPGWMAVLWVFIPIAGDIYYAFLKA